MSLLTGSSGTNHIRCDHCLCRYTPLFFSRSLVMVTTCSPLLLVCSDKIWEPYHSSNHSPNQSPFISWDAAVEKLLDVPLEGEKEECPDQFQFVFAVVDKLGYEVHYRSHYLF